jgi:hypothetical protein
MPEANAPHVTIENYVRAETDFQFRGYIAKLDCFGRLVHYRAPYDVHNQVTVSGNRDTLYSFGVFDLTSSLTVQLPDPGDRYQSLMIVSEDHSIEVAYGPTEVTLTAESVGTRYVMLAGRTFADPADEADMRAAHALQDQISVQQAEIGVFDVPAWDQHEVEDMRRAVNVVGAAATDSSKMFGRKEELDPIYWTLGAAFGWGGLPAVAATYGLTTPDHNDGQTPYTLHVADVPVDAFWSVTVYDSEKWIPINDLDAYSYNGVTAEHNGDGSVTIHFGGDPDQPNCLPIVPGWSYIFRAYRPREEILNGSWSFPQPEVVD